MATVTAITAQQFTKDEAERLIELIGEATITSLDLAPQYKDVYLQSMPEGFTTKLEQPRITFFVYTAPNKTEDNKRRLIRAYQDAVDAFYGGSGKVGTVVIFKIHEDINVGVNGVMRLDSKKA
ncbi:MAG: hypothetical protein ACI4TF_09205 [Oliverpabstia sp.]